jgi:predicted SAM-dependent methyltransferase
MKRQGIKKAKIIASTFGELKLELGCGSFKRQGFIGIDLLPGVDIQWDIRWGIPFEDESVTEIKSDHFFEHLELSDLIKVLRECRRVLVAGGVLNFTVPHLDPYLEAYRSKNYNYLKEKIYDIPQGMEDLYNTCFDRIAWVLFRSGEHKSSFDKESILAKVKLAGFENITLKELDPIKDMNQRFSSINLVVVK